MTVQKPKCAGTCEISVIYAWPGALRYPTVYHLCEPCADYLCTRIEQKSWPGSEAIAYLALVESGFEYAVECDSELGGRW